MEVRSTALEGVRLIQPTVFGDPRGLFVETWSRDRYAQHGMDVPFVQDNISRSHRGTLRGMHLQHPHGQGKLLHVVVGEIFDVVIDVRVGSPTFGRWEGYLLSAENHQQLYVPTGLAHGFCVTSDHAVVAYKCTDLYHPEAELGVVWNDPEIGVEWPIVNPVLSDKDRRHPRLCEIARERLPRYGA
jgi:dTDP-4-dehydrorhamnose 3,5-epimerase